MNERRKAAEAKARPKQTAAPVVVDLDRGRWAPATRRAYEDAWADFVTFGGTLPADAQTIADFLTARAETLATSTISTRLAAIHAVHELYGHPIKMKGSVIADAWADIRRRKGLAKTPKAALVLEDIKRIVAGIPATKLLDRAVLLIGFASAMRRSELAALNVDDLEFTEEGLHIHIRRSKTDKSGKGQPVAIRRTGTDFCAVSALERWLQHAAITEGAIFRTNRDTRMAGRRVATLVKRWAKRAGFRADQVAAHSLRRGCITSMFRNGSDLKGIMQHSRHKTVDIAMGYVEAQRAMENPAIANLGL